MILDFRASIGRVPTAGQNWTAEDLLMWADRRGIDDRCTPLAGPWLRSTVTLDSPQLQQ